MDKVMNALICAKNGDSVPKAFGRIAMWCSVSFGVCL